MHSLSITALSLVLAAVSPIAASALPRDAADKLVYRDAKASPKERAEDLLARMTWKEKVGQMGGVRRALSSDLVFNRTSYDEIHELQNGNLGM
jgi:hypothetical protein